MSRAPVKRPREWQKQLTRERILEAALAIIRKAGEDSVTMAAIATSAGITERTIFRHFDSRDALLQIAWQGLVNPTGERLSADALIKKPRQLFCRWDKNHKLVQSSVHSQAALNARKSAIERRLAVLTGVWSELHLMDHDAALRRAAIVDLISSPHAWEVLEQVWGLSGAEAGKAASEALEVLFGRRAADS